MRFASDRHQTGGWLGAGLGPSRPRSEAAAEAEGAAWAGRAARAEGAAGAGEGVGCSTSCAAGADAAGGFSATAEEVLLAFAAEAASFSSFLRFSYYLLVV